MPRTQDKEVRSVKDRRERVEITKVHDELTRRELIRRAGIGAIVLVYGGSGVKTAVAGVPKFRHKELAGTLRIMQWSHFVPAYDRWFDNVYIKRWGQANDTEVRVDHVNLAELPTRATAEVAARSGHDLFQFLAPPAQHEDNVIALNDVVQQVEKKVGKISAVGRKSTYNPRTKKYFGFADNYVPDPIHYRTDYWGETGLKPTSWENIRKAAPRLKAMGHPVGIGMSNELDSNMALIALLQNYGAFIQNREGRVTIKSKGTLEALKVMRDIYKRGMTSEVFAWTASSNNDAFLAGRLSLALNAISIARSAELRNLPFNRNIGILPIAKGPAPRMGLEHVMGVYVIWKFAQNKRAAKKFLVDIGTKYTGHFLNSYFYNFPAFPRSVTNIRTRLAKQTDYPNEFRGRYVILDDISRKWTTNVGYPGYSNAAIDEVFSKFLIPQMFARVARDDMTPDEAMRAAHREVSFIFNKWRRRKKI
jgi:multiple sugar transport system substrate-binding protein